MRNTTFSCVSWSILLAFACSTAACSRLTQAQELTVRVEPVGEPEKAPPQPAPVVQERQAQAPPSGTG